MGQRHSTPPPGRFGKPDLARMGHFLREERLARNLTLRALAETSGLSVGAIRALEGGQANPGLATVLAVVEALGIDLDKAVEAARTGRDTVVVRRAGGKGTGALPGAALRLDVSDLPSKSVGPALAPAERHPGMGLVVDGPVLAVLRSGARHRLESGDVFHAQPGVVQGLASTGPRPARVLHVVDTRRQAAPDGTTHRRIETGEGR
jgi:transcriptional regulator with XRE-family HTH domain